MKTPLAVSLIQTALIWENPKANRSQLEKLISKIDETDLIILPEMFTTGFSMKSDQLFETMQGESIEWMKTIAVKKKAAICGSLIIKENSSYYNRLVWVEENGTIHSYDKRHLFRMADENNHFKEGKERLIIPLKEWRVCPLICYDLRFPVWSRNVNEQFDLLLYVANWPEARISAWEKLLYARAIENQCFVGAVNRIGEDEKQISYSGNSMLIDPKGEKLWKAKDHQEEVKTILLDKKSLDDFRAKFPVGKDADRFTIQ